MSEPTQPMDQSAPIPPAKAKTKGLNAPQVILIFLLLASTAAGVYFLLQGSVKTNITGTVTRDGKPLEWPKAEGNLLVIFVPEPRQENDSPVRAECDRQAGTFRFESLRAGRYRVAVHMFDERHMDALGNKFDPGNSPLYHTVESNNQVINVDIPSVLPEAGGPPRKR
jgi:hypothetical protein